MFYLVYALFCQFGTASVADVRSMVLSEVETRLFADEGLLENLCVRQALPDTSTEWITEDCDQMHSESKTLVGRLGGAEINK